MRYKILKKRLAYNIDRIEF